MVVLKETPTKRPASLLALDYITAPPSAVIAVGTVAARVQAWQDVINNPEQDCQSPIGPSPPSKRHIETRDGSDRGVRSSFGRRSELAFGQPAGRSQRIAPEGRKRDGLPPVGSPTIMPRDAFNTISGGDIEEYRLAGIIRAMTSLQLSTGRRMLARSYDSIDTSARFASVPAPVGEGRFVRRREALGTIRSINDPSHMGGHSTKTNESPPKDAIDELGDLIDEALEHHRTASGLRSADIEKVNRDGLLEQHKLQSWKTMPSRIEDAHVRWDEIARSKPRSQNSRMSSAQTPLIERMAAEELAMYEGTKSLDRNMICSMKESPTDSSPSRDQGGTTLIRRETKRRRGSSVFRDYPMDDLPPSRPRRLTADSVLSNHSRQPDHLEPYSSISTPGLGRCQTFDDRRPHHQPVVSFRSSGFRGVREENSMVDEDKLDDETEETWLGPNLDDANTARMESPTVNERAKIETLGTPLAKETIELPPITTPVTESDAEMSSSIQKQSPKASKSDTTSPRITTPKAIAWPFRWRLALTDKQEQERRAQLVESCDSKTPRPMHWGNRSWGTRGEGTNPELANDSTSTSVSSGSDSGRFRRTMNRSRSDPQLSRSRIEKADQMTEESATPTLVDEAKQPSNGTSHRPITPGQLRSHSMSMIRRTPRSSRRKHTARAWSSKRMNSARAHDKSAIEASRSSLESPRKNSEETVKPIDGSRNTSTKQSSRVSRSNSVAKEDVNKQESKEQSEAEEVETREEAEKVVARRSGDRTPRVQISRRPSRYKQSGETITSAKTFGAKGSRGRTLTIKVEIRTMEGDLDLQEERTRDLVVVKAELGPNRELSIDSEGGN